MEGFRTHVLDVAERALGVQDPAEALRAGRAILDEVALTATRERLIEHHSSQLAPDELDAEAGRRSLAIVAGGGGGSGFPYIGAWQSLDALRLYPRYLLGNSIGSILGAFRTRLREPQWDRYEEIGHSLRREQMIHHTEIAHKFGLPGLVSLRFTDPLDRIFRNEQGERLVLGDTEIPFEVLVGGVRKSAQRHLPARFHDHDAAREHRRLGFLNTAHCFWELLAFFDQRIVKAVLLGADELSAGFEVRDAVGFSAAVPGILHYDIHDDARMDELCSRICAERGIFAMVDGGVVANVPIELAFRRLRDGVIGTRNALIVAFDCFRPTFDAAHLWMQPLAQALHPQVTRNRPFADLVVPMTPVPSPLNLVPTPAHMSETFDWGRASIGPHLEHIMSSLEPVDHLGQVVRKPAVSAR
ncbi:hypothetical protein AS9A_2919 [Hoyosella subflava DQS3-9A1]|uniref:PNPLA domain-containing protein n=2 Tax=Hoyosella TaxID=697025 RepID=F6EK07_HOYSD|nr:hypothetical protein AS9A_2919 [Hoyosella subflava DQS3-9A1]